MYVKCHKHNTDLDTLLLITYSKSIADCMHYCNLFCSACVSISVKVQEVADLADSIVSNILSFSLDNKFYVSLLLTIGSGIKLSIILS